MKVLYLPTGAYITFQYHLGGFTDTLDAKTRESYGFHRVTDTQLLIELTKIEKFDTFARRNNIVFPIQMEHFEVIYEQ
jgi:hypothetical protein